MVSLESAYLEGLKLREINRIEESNLIFDTLIETKADPLILLEIGRLYFKEGQLKKARNVFHSVKKNFNLRPLVKEKVNRYLYEIKHQEGYWTYSFNLINTKNPKRKPVSGVYKIFGIPLQFENKENKNYLGTNNEIAFYKKLKNSLDLTSRFNFLDYEGQKFDEQSIQINLRDENSISNFSKEYNVTYNNAQEYSRSSIGARLGYKDSKIFFDLAPSIGFYFTNNSAIGYKEGRRIDFSVASYSPFSDPNSTIYLQYQKENLEFESNSNTSGSIYFEKRLSFSKLLIVPSIKYLDTQFEGMDPSWAKKRKDNSYEIKISFCPQIIGNENINSVCLAWLKEKRNSNIQFYNFEEDSFSVNYVKTF